MAVIKLSQAVLQFLVGATVKKGVELTSIFLLCRVFWYKNFSGITYFIVNTVLNRRQPIFVSFNSYIICNNMTDTSHLFYSSAKATCGQCCTPTYWERESPCPTRTWLSEESVLRCRENCTSATPLVATVTLILVMMTIIVVMVTIIVVMVTMIPPTQWVSCPRVRW